MDNPDKKERRSAQRLSFKERVLINGSVSFKSIDISEGGLYIYTGRSFEKNSLLEVTFMDRKFTVKTRVMHNQPGVGTGLQFINMSEEQKEMIRKVVKDILKKTEKHTHEKRKVLLVEDNALTRSIYKGKLLMEGFSVMEAKDGVEALKALREQIPDIIVLDLQLERMDGIKFLAIVKKNSSWGNIPVLVFSGTSSKDVMNNVMEAGADKFLSKRVTSPAKLAETVRAMIMSHYAV